MSNIEQQGPYTIERKGPYSINITSDVQFNATLSFGAYVDYPIATIKQGNKYALTAMALTEDMVLTLKTQGLDDVVVRNTERALNAQQQSIDS